MGSKEQTAPGASGRACDFFNRFEGMPLIIAHRGYRACYPENTLCAFAHSLGRSDMVELDVQLSADGVAVVFHDDHLARTSNAAALAPELGLSSLALRDWSLAQLRRLDVGSWFLAADPFATIRQGLVDGKLLRDLMPQQLPTLAETLTWAVGNQMPLNVELKDMGQTRLNDALVAQVVAEVRAAGASAQVIVSSFNHHALRACRQTAPEIAVAALQEGVHPPNLTSYLRDLGACAYHPADDVTDQALVTTLRAAGFAVNVFTVNDPGRQRQLFAFGATGVFTDFPELCS
jgi:glycerophosphoryl diester phosphodiesterase